MEHRSSTDSTQIKSIILADDLELIREVLSDFSRYDFAEDIRHRMEEMGLSANALAQRCFVTHTMVGKWLGQNAHPQGKERMKELGMALGMDEKALNEFLYSNCYPRLYAKSPLDNACKLVLKTFAGRSDVVKLYRDFLDMYKLKAYTPSPDRVEIPTYVMSRNFDDITSARDFEKWLAQYEKHFGAFAKTQIPNQRLIRFILLYIGQTTINDLYATGELPVTIKNLLYPLVADKEIALKGLRSKLIVFGLYKNMTEEEMDIMLSYAKVRPLSEPKTKLDNAVLTALRCAHERYPYFEYSGMEKLTAILKASMEQAQSQQELDNHRELLEMYEKQMENALMRLKYYDNNGHKSEIDRLFEEYYTDYADSSIIHYMKDVLCALAADGVLADAEINTLLDLMESSETW